MEHHGHSRVSGLQVENFLFQLSYLVNEKAEPVGIPNPTRWWWYTPLITQEAEPGGSL